MKITGLILAGGEGRRMGGCDKGLQTYQGRPLVAHVLERLAPQVDNLLISANRNGTTYQDFGYPVVNDTAFPDYAGPLAGLLEGLRAAREEWILVAPCDTPLLPLDLAATLRTALVARQSELAYAVGPEREHPVFCLCHRRLAPSLAAFLANGGRKVRAWQAEVGGVPGHFPEEAAFRNFNTLADLAL